MNALLLYAFSAGCVCGYHDTWSIHQFHRNVNEENAKCSSTSQAYIKLQSLKTVLRLTVACVATATCIQFGITARGSGAAPDTAATVAKFTPPPASLRLRPLSVPAPHRWSSIRSCRLFKRGKRTSVRCRYSSRTATRTSHQRNGNKLV